MRIAYGSVSEMENHTGRDGELKCPGSQLFWMVSPERTEFVRFYAHDIGAGKRQSGRTKGAAGFSNGNNNKEENFMNTTNNTSKLVILGLMTGILLLMAYTPLGYLNIGAAGDYI